MSRKIIFIAYSDFRGGAAKAAARIFRSLVNTKYELSFISAERRVGSKISSNTRLIYYIHFLFRLVAFVILKFAFSKNHVKKSLNVFSSPFVCSAISECNDFADIYHVHWVNNETLSFSRLANLSCLSSMIVTLHDEWFYCATEHYCYDFLCPDSRFLHGYYHKADFESGIDVNKWIWKYKLKHIHKFSSAIFTVPSTWMKMRAEKSLLLRSADVRVVPNPIPVSVFNPHPSRSKLRAELLGVEETKFVIGFGAVGGTDNPIKGFDLLLEALRDYSATADEEILKNTVLVVFGGKQDELKINGYEVLSVGHVATAEAMANLYNVFDLTIVPSRVESFGQVAAESMACGTPVVTFDYSGMADIVDHKINGYLAKPHCSISLASGIHWFRSMDKKDLQDIKTAARNKIVNTFSEEIVSKLFENIYAEFDKKG